jgi:hypothetical protein
MMTTRKLLDLYRAFFQEDAKPCLTLISFRQRYQATATANQGQTACKEDAHHTTWNSTLSPQTIAMPTRTQPPPPTGLQLDRFKRQQLQTNIPSSKPTKSVFVNLMPKILQCLSNKKPLDKISVNDLDKRNDFVESHALVVQSHHPPKTPNNLLCQIPTNHPNRRHPDPPRLSNYLFPITQLQLHGRHFE